MAHILPRCTDSKNDLLRKIVTLSQQRVAPESPELAPRCNDSNRDLYVKFLKIVNRITAAFGPPENP